MSGTSLDGVDAAWLDTDGVTVQAFGPTLTVPYDDALRRDLRMILDRAVTLAPDDRCLISVVERLTDYHIHAVQRLGCSADLIGFHGQTILHQPHNRRTWQIGNASRLARQLGVPVVYDFRSADVAAGGQGAPLAPVYHSALASSLQKPLAVLNIGGVANVTWIGRDGSLLAFDTGPGNGLLDDWTFQHTGKAYDKGGLLARAGRPAPEILARLLTHTYFTRSSPKSLDRLEFADALNSSELSRLSPEDGAATLAAFTIGAITTAVFPERPRRWLVSGGGRHNDALMTGLAADLPVPVEPVEVVGWDGDSLEAQCFGFLATRVEKGMPLSFPGTTGVPLPTAGGKIAYDR